MCPPKKKSFFMNDGILCVWQHCQKITKKTMNLFHVTNGYRKLRGGFLTAAGVKTIQKPPDVPSSLIPWRRKTINTIGGKLTCVHLGAAKVPDMSPPRCSGARDSSTTSTRTSWRRKKKLPSDELPEAGQPVRTEPTPPGRRTEGLLGAQDASGACGTSSSSSCLSSFSPIPPPPLGGYRGQWTGPLEVWRRFGFFHPSIISIQLEGNQKCTDLLLIISDIWVDYQSTAMIAAFCSP